MSRFRLVFDLDDTLYPERQFAQSGFRAAAVWARQAIGPDRFDGIEHDMLGLLDEGHLGGLFALVLEARLGEEAARHLDGFIAAYRDHTPDIALFADAAALLGDLGVLGGSTTPEAIGLITDGTPGVQAAKVKALGLEQAFAHVVFTHGLGGRAFAKPHPASFEAMERALGGPGTTLVYIGDNPAKDFVTPNARGWVSVRVRRPVETSPHRPIHHRAGTAPGGSAQIEIASLADLAVALGL